MKTRLLIVEDHAILRDGLRNILSDFQEFEIVGEAEDGLGALLQCETCCPDLVLLDLTLPKLDGIEVLRRMKRQRPELAVLVLTMHRSKQFLQASLEAGADGYCLKDAQLDELIVAMRSIRKGRQYIDSNMLCFLEQSSAAEGAALPPGQKCAVSLTTRETEILRLVAEGHTNHQIAALLSISERTVDNHCTNLRNKVGANSKRALTAYALRAGLA